MKRRAEKTNRKLRVFTGCLITAAGSGLVAALWFRELTAVAVVDALLGAVYLVIAIGVFGQSRFSLFLAGLVPALVAVVVFSALESQGDLTIAAANRLTQLRIAIDITIAASASIALWRARKLPSI